ncbi:unnamed protein product, partial [Closterium sp. Naga37s-1]
WVCVVHYVPDMIDPALLLPGRLDKLLVVPLPFENPQLPDMINPALLRLHCFYRKLFLSSTPPFPLFPRPDMIDPALLRPGRLDKLLFIPLPDAPSRAAILCTLIRSIPRAEDVNVELMSELAGVGDGGASATAAAAAVTEGAAGETGAAVGEGAGDKKTGSVEQRGGGSAGGGGGEIDGSYTGGREGGGREQTGEDSSVVPLEVQKARDRKGGGKLPGAARGRKAPCDGFSGADLAALVS